ncbi:MAG: type II secretion system protein [Patescibacteria group bacterium]|jgi:type IV pilus assembly protein PilA
MKKGFTLIEILLVVAAIAILAGIVIIAINPAKQLAEVRNAQRWENVNTILNGVYQYSIDHNGDLPTTINENSSCAGYAVNEICYGSSCASYTNLSALTTEEVYLVGMPRDPSISSGSGSGYFIHKTEYDRVEVCAPEAELEETISVKR